MSSSIWGSRFHTNATAAASHNKEISADADINDVLAAAYEVLPQIGLNFLTADKSLGKGSMFHVRREIYDERNEPPLQYYVAVKYMRVENNPSNQRQIIRSLLRELRGITHPQIRGHPHIISAFGYGWTDSISGEPRMYLVMEYADFGTLSECLQAVKFQRPVTVQERHQLALDVACGLQALHENGIIHGDLKADNVLVFQRTYPLGYNHHVWEVPWEAKIADFGSSLTREEANNHTFRYTGTALYNAPEIESTLECGFSNAGSFVSYMSADVYSFGLLLWEVMNFGRFYLSDVEVTDTDIKEKRYHSFLDKKNRETSNALLNLALESLYDIETETDESHHAETWKTIAEVLTFCLQRTPTQRKSAAAVYEKLQNSATGHRPPVIYSLPRMRSAPPRKPASVGRETPGYTQFTVAPTKPIKAGSDGQIFRAVARDTNLRTESRLIPFRSLDSRNDAEIGHENRETIKLQKADMAPRPPREIQKRMIVSWKAQVEEACDATTVSEALLELSACHLLGFGVEQDLNKSLEILRQARVGSQIARRIFGRVSAAFETQGNTPSKSQESPDKTSYFSNRLRAVSSRIIIHPNILETPQLSMRPRSRRTNIATNIASLILSLIMNSLQQGAVKADTLDLNHLDQLWAEQQLEVQQPPLQGSLSQIDISAALTEACKTGSFEAARVLASMCMQYIGPHGEPTPLHWLIMFPPEEAEHMAEVLILGRTDCEDLSLRLKLRKVLLRHHDGDDARYGGVCSSSLNTQSSCGVYLPEHCLELVGTPLHWAVRCHNLSLVRLLLDYGAQPSVRCKVRSRLPGEPNRVVPLNYNALDIALEYHLFDIAEELFDRAQRSKKLVEVGASLLARTTTTWARFIIHGPSYRYALRQTIEVLVNHGWNIDRPDYFNESPFLVALSSQAEEPYIITELLRASQRINELHVSHSMNLATLVVTCSEADTASSAWKMQQVLPLIEDLNELDGNGRNALHYCALLGNPHIAKLLLSTIKVEVNARAMGMTRSTALMYAAEFGRTEIVELLLNAGANPDFPSEFKQPGPLELAVLNRQYETASQLIKYGANIDFGVRDGFPPRSTVLHAACIQGSGRPPIVKCLLQDHPKLRNSVIVNRIAGVNSISAPLCDAAYYADLESAEALLEHGANPNQGFYDLRVNPLTSLPELYCTSSTARDLVERTIKRASGHGLDKSQLRVALHGGSESMRGIPFQSTLDREMERAEWSADTTILPQFDFRLEDIRDEKQGQAGVRAFITRLEEIMRLMDEFANKEALPIS